MNRLLFLLTFFPLLGFGQTTLSITNKVFEKVNKLALTDFIKGIILHKRISIDALFIKKRIYEEENMHRAYINCAWGCTAKNT